MEDRTKEAEEAVASGVDERISSEKILEDFKRKPFNFGIKELKRVLDRMDMPKAEKNRTIKMYKERLYARVEEVKEKMEKVVPTQEQLHATDK